MNLERITKGKQNMLKAVEVLAMILVIGSVIWAISVAAGLENPKGDPRLLRAIMVAAFTTSVWAIILVIKEVKQFGWVQALVSIISIILVQLLVYWLFR